MGQVGSTNSVRPKPRSATLKAAPRPAARDAIGMLTPGCRVIGLTKGQFSMLDMLAAILEQTGPSDVMVSTWTQGKAEMEGVAHLLRTRQITRFRLLVDRSFVTRHPDYVQHIHAIAGAESLRQTKTHAKFALIAGGGYSLVLRTSMNFNHNPRLEQFDLDDDPTIYAFFAQAVDEVFRVVPAGLAISNSQVEAGFGELRFGSDDGWGFSAVNDYGFVPSDMQIFHA